MTWLLVAEEPYTRKDGKHVKLLVWNRQCAKCEGIVVAKTPVDPTGTKAFTSKHCPKHVNGKGEG